MDAREQTVARMLAAAAPFVTPPEHIVVIVPAGAFGTEAEATWRPFQSGKGKNYLAVATDQRLLLLRTNRTGFSATGSVTVDAPLAGVSAVRRRPGRLVNRLDLTVGDVPRHLYVAPPWSAELAGLVEALTTG